MKTLWPIAFFGAAVFWGGAVGLLAVWVEGTLPLVLTWWVTDDQDTEDPLSVTSKVRTAWDAGEDWTAHDR